MASTLRVLCVDDEPAIRNILTVLLQREGHEVVTAENGLEALNSVTADPAAYGLIITDSEMPVMNGLTFLQKLRQTPFAGKVLVFSSTLSAEKRQALLELGVDGIVAKGGSLNELLAALRPLTR